MGAFLTSIGDIILGTGLDHVDANGILQHVTTVAATVVATPLLLLPVGFFVIGGAAGLLRRFFV